MLNDKPWYQSLTVLGTALFAGAQIFESSGMMPPGTTASVAAVVKAVGEALAIIGIRRKLGDPSKPA